MGKKNEEPPRIRIEGDDGRFIDADWSRSRQRLSVTVRRGNDYDRAQQVLLTPDQVQEFAAFLVAGPHGP
jgi:hypothetical protein